MVKFPLRVQRWPLLGLARAFSVKECQMSIEIAHGGPYWGTWAQMVKNLVEK